MIKCWVRKEGEDLEGRLVAFLRWSEGGIQFSQTSFLCVDQTWGLNPTVRPVMIKVARTLKETVPTPLLQTTALSSSLSESGCEKREVYKDFS